MILSIKKVSILLERLLFCIRHINHNFATTLFLKLERELYANLCYDNFLFWGNVWGIKMEAL